MVFILGEGTLIFCAVALSSFLLMKSEMDAVNLFQSIWLKVLLVSIITQISLYFNDLYEFGNRHNLIDLATHLIQSIGMTLFFYSTKLKTKRNPC